MWSISSSELGSSAEGFRDKVYTIYIETIIVEVLRTKMHTTLYLPK
jgi:hypothetical protein